MKSTIIFLRDNPILSIFLIFLLWRVFLFLAAHFTTGLFPLQPNYLGGGMGNYLSSPLLWGYANFDGEHYLAIARNGYEPLTHFFFPIYPLLIGFLTKLIGNSFQNYLFVSQILSNLFFFLSLVGLYKLLKIDFNQKITYLTIGLILIFPVSYYFVASYNESLFLSLIIWFFYFGRRRKWILAGLLAAAASATRVIGISLMLVLLIEIYLNYRTTHKIDIRQVIALAISPLGLILYVLFLKQDTGDMLVFLHSVGIYGEQRSSSFVYLPQVFFRYIFRIIPTLGLSYLPIVFVTWFELLVGVWLLISSAASFTRLRISYSFYLAFGFIVPTLAGSFSSLPRYALVLFPAFLLTAICLIKVPKSILFIYIIICIVVLTITQAMFLRGFWVS